jgi:hypothetical protein
VKRTQLYLEDDTWQLLHKLAKQSGCTMSDLVRQAVREKFEKSKESRRQALLNVVGLWADRTDLPETDTYVRGLRRDRRSGSAK